MNAKAEVKSFLFLIVVLASTGCVVDSMVRTNSGANVHITNNYAAMKDCYLIRGVGNMGFSLAPDEKAAELVAEAGGDTAEQMGAEYFAYVCDPAKVKAHAEIEARVSKVRITNRPDVVKECKFLQNVTADSESGAQHEAFAAGGDVFFVISDTSRTAQEKASGSSITYNYEIRRMTGEAYRCEPPAK